MRAAGRKLQSQVAGRSRKSQSGRHKKLLSSLDAVVSVFRSEKKEWRKEGETAT